MTQNDPPAVTNEKWYEGIPRYQWLVLIIASAGWVFDVYEGQIFNITRQDMLMEILDGDVNAVKRYGDYFLGIFLAGGTFGGLLFGSLADRYGRRSMMIVTILFYSVFSGLTYFVDSLWQVAALRFLVAMGVGGEWAVAASLVAEVFPTKARAQASSIFHASSILGTWLAAIAGILVGTQWRYAYLIGIIPALLILWVRASVKETDAWKKGRTTDTLKQWGSYGDLLLNPRWATRAILGMFLAAVGLGTFWSVTVAGQDLALERLMDDGISKEQASSTAKFAYGIVQATGGGLGLLSFGPLCAKFGRKPTFIVFQTLALIIVPIVCFVPQSYTQLLILLPVFGFLTLGIHSGYAVYFPELFPTHLRATGTSFCFNGGRLMAVPVLLFSGQLKAMEGIGLHRAVTGLSLLFLLGILIICFLPETRGQELPE
ncbi:MFS transporter [Rubinisphaera sp.]|uniref:MFS transporter n=1 Tax=Rubinisphaera sp. TaxID=2024857 RepID=UPI000C0EADDC|nr:MFS transporter [Rubinisphaera sp.]MBV12267.1 MFS transporter [Rubinisphaera sp.]HCS55278.1 MFS transporter [Planctomycetaceae bacterium]|tara:strand:+ start:8185 stop:9474 length:1290 start_codon:yes stop_codon:yes gene_type:complete